MSDGLRFLADVDQLPDVDVRFRCVKMISVNQMAMLVVRREVAVLQPPLMEQRCLMLLLCLPSLDG